MGTAYRSCKLSNVGSPKTAMHRSEALRFCQAKQSLN
jgi:hypothetical protein